MRSRNICCTVIEVLGSDDGKSLPTEPPVRDLLPWADPYIARLLSRYRLQGALNDSLSYLRDGDGGSLGRVDRFATHRDQ